MTTDRGKQYVIDKLTAARNMTELATVWSTVGASYRREPQIFELKEKLKKQMEGKK